MAVVSNTLRDRVVQFVGAAPWWLCSAVVHVFIIILLATITFNTVPSRPPKVLPIGVVLPPPELPPAPPSPRGPLSREADENEKYIAREKTEYTRKQISGQIESGSRLTGIAIPDPDELAGLIQTWTTEVTPGPAVERPKGPVTTPIHTGIVTDIGGALGEMGESIVRAIQTDALLVVLLFDESRSLLEDRREMTRGLKRVTDGLQKNMKEREWARLKWAVVSYGEKPALWLQPTSDLSEVLNAIKLVKVDETGKENVCAAISFAMRTFIPLKKKMFVVVLTDEEGDDTHNEKAYMQALNDLKTARARLFVFGRESLFQQQNAFEWVRDPRGERIGPWFWVQRGLESCRQEFFTSDWLFNHYRGVVGAGFGCWSLNSLAKLTQGSFFSIGESSSPYDETKLPKFEPEWITPEDYAERVLRSKMRTTMRKIVEEWRTLDPPAALWQFDRMKKERDAAIAKGEKALKFAETAISEMEVLRGRRALDRYAKQRWQANFDLLLAELYKFRFMLRDYVAVLRTTKTAGFPKPRPDQRFNHYRILYSQALQSPHTGQRGMREWDQAKKAFNQVIADYDGTPWAEMARFEMRTMAPITIFPAFDIPSLHEERRASRDEPSRSMPQNDRG